MTGPTGLRWEGVTKRYRTGRRGRADGEVLALDALDLAAEEGELLVLVGPSGSGKSTALRVLAGLEEATAGRVAIRGRDVTDELPARRDVAMVFQDYALYPHLTVAENLLFGLRVRKVPAAEARSRVERAASQVALEGLLTRYPDQLSGGQQQRVAVARALVREPAVYLFDEPLSSLDAQLRARTRAELVDLHQRIGATTVYVTHDQVEAMTLAQRLAVLADGRLQQVGRPEDVYDHPANLFVAGFLGNPPMNLVPGGGVLGGRPATLVGIRPEDLAVHPDGPLEALVVLVEALGSETVLGVTCGDGTRLAVRTPPRQGHRSGDRVCLRPDPERLHQFDAATGQRR